MWQITALKIGRVCATSFAEPPARSNAVQIAFILQMGASGWLCPSWQIGQAAISFPFPLGHVVVQAGGACSIPGWWDPSSLLRILFAGRTPLPGRCKTHGGQKMLCNFPRGHVQHEGAELNGLVMGGFSDEGLGLVMGPRRSG